MNRPMNTPNFHFETCHRISTINSSFLLNSEKTPSGTFVPLTPAAYKDTLAVVDDSDTSPGHTQKPVEARWLGVL